MDQRGIGWDEMVRTVIFVEGGGESKELRTRCREGFSKLIKNMGFAGRMPRIIACGGRDKAYEMFRILQKSALKDEYPVLLVDSEDPVVAVPWDHLHIRDGWDRPAGAEDEQVQMMATCMETWIMADHEALKKIFGSCLLEGNLFPASGLEERSRQELLDALRSATRDCGKGRGYEKGKRSFQILAELNAGLLEEKLHYFRHFKDALGRHL